MDISLFRKWIVEFIGTFFLVYVIGCVSLQDHVLLGPLAIGASLMVMIFAGGHISGGHYNPAVTLGVWIRGACSALEAGFYLVAQVLGAIVAALAAGFLLGHGSSPASIDGHSSSGDSGGSSGNFRFGLHSFERGNRPCYCWQFVLWTGDWFHCVRSSRCRRQGFRGRFQPRRRHWRCGAWTG